MKRRVVSILLMVAMVASLTTGCKKNKDTSVTKEKDQVVAALDQEEKDTVSEEQELEEGTESEEEAPDAEQEEMETESKTEEEEEPQEEKLDIKEEKNKVVNTSSNSSGNSNKNNSSNNSAGNSNKNNSSNNSAGNSNKNNGSNNSAGNSNKNNGSNNSAGNSNKNNGSNNSAGNNNKNNSSNNSAGNSNKPSHTHKWEDVYEDVWVVDQAAYTLEEPIYEKRGYMCCNQCGKKLYTEDEIESHMKANENCGGWHSESENVQVGVDYIEIEEEGHWESKKVGSKCSCGAKK